MQSLELKRFPSTRYQGSKRKLIPWLHSKFLKLEFDSVLDVFGGTGSVSYMFKLMGKQVTYNDHLKFNSIIAKSILSNNNVRLDESEISAIISRRSRNKEFISRNFSGFYYLDTENSWIDRTIANIEQLKHTSKTTLQFKKAIAYNALFQSCLIKRPFNLFHRKNLNLRTERVERSFGNKSAWDRDFAVHYKKFAEEINSAVFSSKAKCQVTNLDLYKLKQRNYDLVYIDPPYILENSNNESSNYLQGYHFLEGIANYSIWKSLIDFESKNLRFDQAYLENHFTRNNAVNAFEFLFSHFRDSTIVISYKTGGYPTIDSLVRMLRKYKRKVSTSSIHYKYALNRQNGNAKNNREYLIIGL